MLTRLVKEVTVAGRTVLLGNGGGVKQFDRTLLCCSKRNVQDSNLRWLGILFCWVTRGGVQNFDRTLLCCSKRNVQDSNLRWLGMPFCWVTGVAFRILTELCCAVVSGMSKILIGPILKFFVVLPIHSIK
jgi:hypothetical protein